MDQIDLTCLISFCRINFCHNAIRSKLHAFNGIRHDIFCDRVKLMEFSILTDQDLLQNIREPNPVHNLVLYTFTIGCCI